MLAFALRSGCQAQQPAAANSAELLQAIGGTWTAALLETVLTEWISLAISSMPAIGTGVSHASKIKDDAMVGQQSDHARNHVLT